jgi:serine/threonine protein kinase
MPNPTTTVTEFCSILTKSRLLPPADIVSLQKKWIAESAGTDTDVEGFRKYLVSKRYLTDYQAALVQRGHADGFYIGGYVILDKIGKGRSAGVYRAVHASGQVVALKVLPQSRAREPHVLARFQREGRLLTRLDHANVVRAYQIGVSEGRHYIVMEHLEGETLDEILARRKKLPPEEAARLIFQALQGVQHLHDKRMVHRDLKPANLIVTPLPMPGVADTTLDATVKILDIGLGRELFDESALVTSDMQLTAEGAVLGTPDYLAPEQARDARSADIRADIYALGCVLYHLIAGQPPFTDKSIMGTMVKHATEPVPPIDLFVPTVPTGLPAVLNRMLAKNPADRYQTPAEAADALWPFLPPDATEATKSIVLPAFEKWLESEPPIDMPEESDGPPTLSLPVYAPQPVSSTEAIPGGTASRRSGTVPPPTRPSAAVPMAEVKPKRSQPAAVPEAIPNPLPHIDVELLPRTVEAPTLPHRLQPGSIPPTRPLYDLDRRDFIMLATGAGGVITAILGGFLAARLMKPGVQGDRLRP